VAILLQARYPYDCPTNSFKALKDEELKDVLSQLTDINFYHTSHCFPSQWGSHFHKLLVPAEASTCSRQLNFTYLVLTAMAVNKMRPSAKGQV